MMKIALIALLAILLLYCPSFAETGTTGLQFLQIGVGGRACGMGEAFVSLCNDASATYWNPSGIAYIDGKEIIFMHNKWLCGTKHEFASRVFPFLKLGSAGISFTYLDYGEIEGMDEYGQHTGAYSAYDLAIGISFARSITPRFSAALTTKIIQSRIDNETGTGFAFDVGMLSHTPIDNLRLGCSIRNIGNGIIFISEKTILPTALQTGLSYTLQSSYLAIIPSLDLTKELKGDLATQGGMELSIRNRIFFRGGYKASPSHKGFTAGAGIVHELSFWAFIMDYAFADYGDIGNSHKMSLGIKM
jgi:hypothetical protein